MKCQRKGCTKAARRAYCSPACRAAAWREKHLARCPNCTMPITGIVLGEQVFTLMPRGSEEPYQPAIANAEGMFVSAGRVTIRVVTGWALRSRVVWCQANGPIPADHVIHHKDHNPLNDRLENLACVTVAEHTSIHKQKRSER